MDFTPFVIFVTNTYLLLFSLVSLWFSAKFLVKKPRKINRGILLLIIGLYTLYSFLNML